MYPVSKKYKEEIRKDGRLFESKIVIEHEKGELELNNDDISLGGLSYKSSTQSGEDFTIGGVVADTLSLSLRNHEKYDDIDFTGAIIKPYIQLLKGGVGKNYVLDSGKPNMFTENVNTPINKSQFEIDNPRELKVSDISHMRWSELT